MTGTSGGTVGGTGRTRVAVGAGHAIPNPEGTPV